MNCVLLAALAAAAMASIAPAPDFAQSSRFFAFRFEATCTGCSSDGAAMARFADDLVSTAEEFSAFGWAQILPAAAAGEAEQQQASTRLVGEVRSTRRDGPALRSFVERGPASSSAEAAAALGPGATYSARVLVHEDARIRLHFADFRLLDGGGGGAGGRDTCFPSPPGGPHECKGAGAAGRGASSAGAERSDGGTGRGEGLVEGDGGSLGSEL